MNRTDKNRASFVLLAVFCTFFTGAWLVDRALADRAPNAPPLTYSGTALMAGVPIADGSHTIGLSLYTHMTGVIGVVCGVSPAATTTSAGRFSIPLTMVECANAIQQGTELWAEVSVDGTTLPRTRIGAVPYAVQAENGVPPGTMMAFGGEIAPLGWIVCDGRALDGDDPQYGALRAAIGTTWGTGTDDSDTATDFNVPDLRGRFIRGFDDAATARDDNRDSRLESAPGGRTGAHVGTLELGSTARPGTPFVSAASGAHGHSIAMVTDGTFTPGNLDYATGGGSTFHLSGSGYGAGSTSVSPDHTHTIAGGGDAETRPENAMALYIIKL